MHFFWTRFLVSWSLLWRGYLSEKCSTQQKITPWGWRNMSSSTVKLSLRPLSAFPFCALVTGPISSAMNWHITILICWRMRIANVLRALFVSSRRSFVDVMTSNNNNLQISFVHSRYRNEDVAICVLVDVSSRVKMEESLQDWQQQRSRPANQNRCF